ncbi:hypothetical protein [Fulvivirga sediminis]|uniref:hypothetical protein n=1 Tax=Fulvivirga sediminis TaxID=2803949 RepID=UPI00293D592C|nr:hypothetical protein [Fulvivirga sediminis]
MHKKLDETLKTGGLIIFEAFSKTHLELRMKNPKVGGPKDLESLFSKEEVASDFANYEPLYFHEELVLLNEGKYHNGESSVIRFVGKKL